jgi:CheY-like chemotaxis protein
MKLDYKIVWVEDKIDSKPFIALVKTISNYLENEFFNVTIETAEDVDEFKEKFAIHDKFDLIITDLNLNESHGDEVIDYIRDEKHIMTEVFFYSANSELKEKPLLNNNRITFYQLDTQNVYKALEKEIIELIDLTISKFQHIVSMRGMIMHETSDLDVQIQELLSQIISVGDSDNIIATIKKKYIKSNDGFNKKMIGLDDLNEILMRIGANHRLRALNRNIDFPEIKKHLETYKEDIIDVRNQFAHAVLDEESQLFVTHNGLKFNSESCRKIRGDIQKHMKNLESLIEKLSE